VDMNIVNEVAATLDQAQAKGPSQKKPDSQ
jgi:hypothetical protein